MTPAEITLSLVKDVQILSLLFILKHNSKSGGGDFHKNWYIPIAIWAVVTLMDITKIFQ